MLMELCGLFTVRLRKVRSKKLCLYFCYFTDLKEERKAPENKGISGKYLYIYGST